MKAIILAAGMGSRLGNLTKHQPKCLIELWGESLLHRQLRQLESIGITDVVVVSGHCANKISELWNTTIVNKNFNNSNMVYSLSLTLNWLNGLENEQVLILYGDIAFSTNVLNSLKNSAVSNNAVVLGNTKWLELWKQRMNNPIEDVETFKFNDAMLLEEIGQPPKSLSELEGQFMGMLKMRANFLVEQLKQYSLDLQAGKSDPNLYMTDLLQAMCIEENVSVELARGQWIELDTIDDYNLYNKHTAQHFGLD
ncbi:phosphocholine cytidylyltransferase family protein [Pseudoalteromonas piscicida]|uniref:MobA-like NTP transferase domain-containing protein n=1 Tax=Pseudoalteromonas piscicida TaxID=43662 RepID=A0A2A5JVU0_PSEO7|nr:phosphocholine cytidylyltransferase family protein [Pseudoalteromonas piscicida]PCK33411.1 hypothetical protein CEX98_02635 [Pseudoalteromonas piscicida]